MGVMVRHKSGAALSTLPTQPSGRGVPTSVPGCSLGLVFGLRSTSLSNRYHTAVGRVRCEEAAPPTYGLVKILTSSTGRPQSGGEKAGFGRSL